MTSNRLYSLKSGQESFRIVDGELAGKRFESGVIYHKAQIPTEYLDRFEEIPAQTVKRRSKKAEANIAEEVTDA